VKNEIAKANIGYLITYTLRGSELFNVKIINRRTGSIILNIKGLDTDNLREIMYAKIPHYRAWSAIVCRYNSTRSDGYNVTGSFVFDPKGNKIYKSWVS
jgi:hypothetical protein